jgi:hypothetical protein
LTRYIGGVDNAKNKIRCISILSSKSSGSSALQRLLCSGTNARHIEYTRHGEHETLYWTKAASILGLPQSAQLGSEVPIAARKARIDLLTLLSQNVPRFVPPSDDQRLIFEGWRALCGRFAPVFVEKSPHHLHQWSCLELMARAASKISEIDFRFIGLVRNPMDMLYSAWKRWRLPPQNMQYEWYQAHQNLQRFKELVGERLTTVSYEALVGHDAVGQAILRQFAIEGPRARFEELHQRSLQLWRRDLNYAFDLDARVYDLAVEFGYSPEELLRAPAALSFVPAHPAQPASL